ncbi:MAG: hypothetical protein WCP24_00825 [bacterium]
MNEKEQDKDQRLANIEVTLKNIYKVLKPTRWEMFVQGLWRAVGYLVGLMLAIVLIGWFLNMIGVIPFMSEFSENMKNVLNIARTK